jgi:hypothetical protein
VFGCSMQCTMVRTWTVNSQYRVTVSLQFSNALWPISIFFSIGQPKILERITFLHRVT